MQGLRDRLDLTLYSFAYIVCGLCRDGDVIEGRDLLRRSSLPLLGDVPLREVAGNTIEV